MSLLPNCRVHPAGLPVMPLAEPGSRQSASAGDANVRLDGLTEP